MSKRFKSELTEVAHELKSQLAGIVMGCNRMIKDPDNLKPLENAVKLFPTQVDQL